MTTSDPIVLAADILSAFVSKNSVPSAELAALFEGLHASLKRLTDGEVAPSAVEPSHPAVSIRKSVTPEYLICLDDGRRFKSLRRHLTALGMTPEQYRQKWKLPSDYPMVASNYAAQRSALAKSIGLGQLRTKPGAAVPAKADESEAALSGRADTIEMVAPEVAKTKAASKKAASPLDTAVKRKRPRKVTA